MIDGGWSAGKVDGHGPRPETVRARAGRRADVRPALRRDSRVRARDRRSRRDRRATAASRAECVRAGVRSSRATPTRSDLDAHQVRAVAGAVAAAARRSRAGRASDDLLPRPAELSRIDGRLLQVPRNLDVRLLHYRRDLIADGAGRRGPSSSTSASTIARDGATAGRRSTGFSFPVATPACSACSTSCWSAPAATLFDDDLQPGVRFDGGRVGRRADRRACTTCVASRRASCPTGTTTRFRRRSAPATRPWCPTGRAAITSIASPATCRVAGSRRAGAAAGRAGRHRAPPTPAATRSRFHARAANPEGAAALARAPDVVRCAARRGAPRRHPVPRQRARRGPRGSGRRPADRGRWRCSPRPSGR